MVSFRQCASGVFAKLEYAKLRKIRRTAKVLNKEKIEHTWRKKIISAVGLM